MGFNKILNTIDNDFSIEFYFITFTEPKCA